MNCYHFRATQKSIPDAQKLIWLGGGHSIPSDKGLTESFIQKNRFYIRNTQNKHFHFDHLSMVRHCGCQDDFHYIPALAEHRVIIIFRSMH